MTSRISNLAREGSGWRRDTPESMKILIIDDEENIRKTTAVALKAMGHEPFEAANGESAMALAQEGMQVAFLDLRLGSEDGLELLPRLLECTPNLNVVVFTAHASIETAVDAIKKGASDYVEKPFTPDQIRIVLNRIESTRKLQNRVDELEARLSDQEAEGVEMVSASPAMQKTYATARKAAASEANILILGESGTGKTILANAIHRCSPRRKSKFVTVSCPSLTKELLTSELFGKVRGSFTGAVRDSWGKVAFADGGTLFLDEVGDLPLDIQPKLLRLLQEKEYERVGETVTRRADVRVIAASNHDLEKAVAEGNFREDLLYRLNVIALEIPPLRKRKEDLESLVKGFVEYFARQCQKQIRGFSPAAMQWIRQHPWPGNIRELRNFVERAVILAEGEELEIESTSPTTPPARQSTDNQSNVQLGDPVSLEELEREHIRQVIEKVGTMREAAKILGIDPATLYRKRKREGSLPPE